ncbi:MAG: DUF5362 family protein [Lysobacteraceae bacterium]
MHAGNSPVQQIMRPLVDGKFWMKLLGVVWIIMGALQALTIIGILWAWIPIWLGVLTFQAASAAEQAMTTDDPVAATRATDKLRVFFLIQGILLLIGLLLIVAVMLMGGLAAIAGLAGSGY